MIGTLINVCSTLCTLCIECIRSSAGAYTWVFVRIGTVYVCMYVQVDLLRAYLDHMGNHRVKRV